MPANDFNMLWKAIDVLEAQEHISATKSIQYPHLTKAGRTKHDKQMFKIAYPPHIYKKDSKNVSFLLNKIGGNNGRRQ